MKYFEDDPVNPNHVALPYFVTCFSELEDDLSQWRAYGGGENGYAIGFRTGSLAGIPSCFLARVTYYETAKHKHLLEEVAVATLSFYKEGLAEYGTSESERWTNDFLAAWDLAITQIAPLFKHSAFAGEKECRLVKGYLGHELPDLHFIQKNSMLTRHLPIRPQSAARESSYRLPIERILIGPCRYPHVSRISIGTLLQQCGFDSSKVSISANPFQAT